MIEENIKFENIPNRGELNSRGSNSIFMSFETFCGNQKFVYFLQFCFISAHLCLFVLPIMTKSLSQLTIFFIPFLHFKKLVFMAWL